MSSYLKHYSILHELNTLDACWIAVDVWSNSSRCRQESVYLSRTWCLYTWSYLDILITMLNSVNCSTIICSPTIEYLCSQEKPQVKPMAPGSIFIILNLPILSYFLCFFTLLLFYFASLSQKYYSIIFIWSHSRKWPWRDWQPLIALVARIYLFV